MLADAIAATFRRRATIVPEVTPVGLSDEFACERLSQRRWIEFLSRLRFEDAPQSLVDVVRQIRARLEAAVERARRLSSEI